MISRRLALLFLAATAQLWPVEGMPYLKLKEGGRATGLAGAAVALPLGVDGVWYSPASVVGGERLQLGLSHQAWLGDSSVDSIALIGRPSWRHTLGLYGDYVTADDTKRDGAGNDIGTIPNSASLFGVIWNVNWDLVTLGFGLKEFSQNFAGSQLQGFAADGGLQFALAERHLRLGMAFQNLGFSSANYYLGSGTSTPLTFRAGFALDSVFIQGLLLSLEMRDDLINEEMSLAAGAEYALSAGSWQFALRGGWDGSSSGAGDLAGMVLGGGITLSSWVADFNWIPMGPLGNPYHISLGWHFGGPPDLEQKAYLDHQEERRDRVMRYRQPLSYDTMPRSGSEEEMADQASDEGDTAMREQNFELARRCFREAISYNPKGKRGWQGLGNAYYYLGKKDEALGAYQQALAADPEDVTLKEFIAKLESALSLPK